jgi:phage terminase large subunit GpA-like protein
MKPTEDLTVSAWADKYRIIPKEGGAKEPGRWRTSRVPYLREIMDCLSASSPVTRVVVKKGTQLGLTEGGNNMFGYTVHIDPAPMMILLPTIDIAKRHSKTKVKNTILQTPELAERIPEARERDSGNTVLFKEFPGGSLIISGANSAASLRNVSIKKLILDEVDAYEPDLDSEGDTCLIAIKRTDAFGDDKKVLEMSTPTIKGVSRIDADYENSDQRHYHVPCPFCGHKQELVQDGFVYDADDFELTGEVYYRCSSCNELIAEHHKTYMLGNGEWVEYNPGHRTRGYHLPSWYSPLGFLSWRELWQEYLDARKNMDMLAMKVWKNTRAAEVWDDEEQPAIDNAQLYNRREGYGITVPMAGLVLTCTVDVQDDRLEAEIKAHGFNEESWTIDYEVIDGVPDQAATWDKLTELRRRTYWHESGAPMRAAITLIDSGGHFSQQVYDYCRKHRREKVFCSKGSQFPGKPIFERAKRQKGGLSGKVDFFIGTDTAKDTLFARLNRARQAAIETEVFLPLTDKPVEICAYYLHFNEACDEEYFRQLVAEKSERQKIGSRIKRKYVQIRDRNEALDVNVLALAAVRILKPNFTQLITALAKKKASMPPATPPLPQAASAAQATADNPPPESAQAPRPMKQRINRTVIARGRGRGWMNGWR